MDHIEYSVDPEYQEETDIWGPIIYRHEINALGLEESELLYPGSHVDAHIRVNNGTVPDVTFRSKIIVSAGEDADGQAIPSIHGIKFFGQNWETGGAYLDPQARTPEEFG